ncbi:MAG: hypothetical protein KAS49_03040 [Candidatus Cloacimonetes bacterium]|nr:hypothetical protein [Candidatus Cloacimonadota bacterium]
MGINYGYFNFGLQWFYSAELSLGITANNLLPWYKKKISNKTGESIVQAGLFIVPQKYAIGLSYHSRYGKFELDSEIMAGNYGGKSTKNMTLWIARAGWEKDLSHHFLVRSGVLIPLIMRSSSLGELSIPPPGFDASLGLGYSWKRVILDFAIFGDPGRSYVEHTAHLGTMLSISVIFN